MKLKDLKKLVTTSVKTKYSGAKIRVLQINLLNLNYGDVTGFVFYEYHDGHDAPDYIMASKFDFSFMEDGINIIDLIDPNDPDGLTYSFTSLEEAMETFKEAIELVL